MKYIIVFTIAGFLSLQAMANPTTAGGQQNPNLEKEFMELFKKQCADFPDKLEKCSPFECEVRTKANEQSSLNVKNIIKGIGNNGLCHFTVETFVDGMPPLSYNCQYSDTTRALIVKVARKQMASTGYKPSKEEEKLMMAANKKDCQVAGLDQLLQSLQFDESQKKQLREEIESRVKESSDGFKKAVKEQDK